MSRSMGLQEARTIFKNAKFKCPGNVFPEGDFENSAWYRNEHNVWQITASNGAILEIYDDQIRISNSFNRSVSIYFLTS